MAGWEGATHDIRIFLDVIRKPYANFPKPPPSIVYIFFNLIDYECIFFMYMS